ncbi:MAG: HlyD family efflux transporter periplasmic adaptor subunit [Lachnospiraceae bacterium]
MGNIYRKASIDRLSSPEQLDKLIQITSPSLWISVVGAAIVVASALIWAIFGTLPENVDINGIYMSDAGTQSIYAATGGTVISVPIEKNQKVKKGDTVAVVADEKNEIIVQQLKDRIRAVESVTLTSQGDVATSDNAKMLECKMQYAQANMTYEQKVETLNAFKTQLDKAKGETASYKAKLEEAEKKYLAAIGDDGNNQATYAYQQAQGELQGAQNQYQAAAKIQSELMTQVAGNQSSYNEGKAQYSILAAQASALEQDVNQLNNAQAQYNQLVMEYQGKVIPAEVQQRMKELEQKIGELSSAPQSLGQVQAQMVTLQSQIAQFEELLNQLNIARAEVNTAKVALTDAKNKYDSAEVSYRAYYTSQGSRTAEQTKFNTAFSQASSLYSNAYSNQMSIENQMAQIKLETSQQGDVSEVDKENLQNQFVATRQSILTELNQQLEQYNKGEAKVEIKSAVNGTVTSNLVQEGQIVGQGTEVVRIKATEEEGDNIVLCYVPVSSGKKLKPGMNTVATPSTVSEQEYGHIKAEVLSVGTYGVSTEEMKERVGDDLMVQAFQQNGPSIEVVLKLETDENTASGYAWSNKKGETVELFENTIVSGKVRVKEDAPISKLIPFLKEKLQVKTESKK